MQPVRSTIRLVLDWDGTLTKKDTLHLVAAIGYDHNRDADLRSWDEIVQAYLSDYSQHKAQYAPAISDRKSAAEESVWLASLKDVERRSIERVKTAGIFTGVTRPDVVSASRSAIQEEKLQLRDGWRKLLASLEGPTQQASTAPPVSILSVNWSATFIRACLEIASASSPEPNNVILDDIPIFANELPLEEVQQAPFICTSADKLAKFEEVRGEDDHTVIYVGDSATDFDCLIAADVGICVRDDPMGSSQKELKETLERLGFETSRLSPEAFKGTGRGTEVDEVKEELKKRKIWWVTELDEISKFIEHG